MLVFRYGTTESYGPNINFVNPKPVAFQALPIIMVGMFCHLAVVPACGGLRDYWPSLKWPIKTRFRTLVVAASGTMLLCGSIYLPAALSGYFLFGDTIKPNVLVNFGNHAGIDVKFSQVCMFLTVALGYPSSLFVARLSIFNALCPKGVVYMSTMYICVTMGFTLSCLAFAYIAEMANLDIDFILALSSSTVGSLIQFMLPGLMLASLGDKCKGYSLLSFGIILSVVGLFICISQIICKSTESTFCNVLGM